MAFNGSGTFNRIYSWVTDALNGIVVSSSRMDTDTNDIAAGLSNCICKDGQTTVTANIPLGGFKLTNVGTGTAATDAAAVQNANALNMCEFRLTLSTGVPVTTADVTGATTLYCSPYRGNRIALYDGANWNMRTSIEFSIALGTLTSGLPYDVFCFDNSGTPTLEILAWTNGTTRATALTTQNGVLVKTGFTTRRFMGTFYTTSTTATEDSVANRYLSNYYNRVRRPMRALEATDTWTYTTATLRQANGSTANQLNFVSCSAEEMVNAEVHAVAINSSAGVTMTVGIGLDVTNANATGAIVNPMGSVSSSTIMQPSASWKGFPGVGKHFLAWLEYSAATGTTTWAGDNGTPLILQAGIHGEVMN